MSGDRPLQEVAIQLGGWVASTKTEVYACITALTALPPSQAVHIYTDSQGLMVGYEFFITRAHRQTPQQLLRTQFNREWGLLCLIIVGCTAPVTLTKVSVHTGT